VSHLPQTPGGRFSCRARGHHSSATCSPRPTRCCSPPRACRAAARCTPQAATPNWLCCSRARKPRPSPHCKTRRWPAAQWASSWSLDLDTSPHAQPAEAASSEEPATSMHLSPYLLQLGSCCSIDERCDDRVRHHFPGCGIYWGIDVLPRQVAICRSEFVHQCARGPQGCIWMRLAVPGAVFVLQRGLQVARRGRRVRANLIAKGPLCSGFFKGLVPSFCSSTEYLQRQLRE